MGKLVHPITQNIFNIYTLHVLLIVLGLTFIGIRHVKVLNNYRLVVLAVLCTLSHVNDTGLSKGRVLRCILIMCGHSIDSPEFPHIIS